MNEAHRSRENVLLAAARNARSRSRSSGQRTERLSTFTRWRRTVLELELRHTPTSGEPSDETNEDEETKYPKVRGCYLPASIRAEPSFGSPHPVRAPKANAFAQRFIRTVRHEVLDLTLMLGRRHLDRILRCYAEHYNAQRPHRGLDLRTPAGTSEPPMSAEVPLVRRIDVLGGLIHEYEAVAA
jgi:hypothetical protein